MLWQIIRDVKEVRQPLPEAGDTLLLNLHLTWYYKSEASLSTY